MKLGLGTEQHQLEWPELLRRVRFAEETGFYSAWVFDHFKPLYSDPKGPCLEGWTLLAALAAATSSIRLGPLVTGATYRHPSLLAAEAVTVDHVSDGRLELAVGAAWFEQEHRELGFPFPGARVRIERLEETIDIMRLLMTEDGVTYEGKHFQLRGAGYNPKPVQKPHPPIWVGGTGERRMLPLVARKADVWHGFGSPASLARRSKLIDEHAAAAGRDPDEIVRSTSLSISEPWDDVRARADALRGAGFTYLIVSWPSEGQGRLDEFVEGVMPDLTD